MNAAVPTARIMMYPRSRTVYHIWIGKGRMCLSPNKGGTKFFRCVSGKLDNYVKFYSQTNKNRPVVSFNGGMDDVAQPQTEECLCKTNFLKFNMFGTTSPPKHNYYSH